MYLGEITRNILLTLIDAAPNPLIFSGYSSSTLNDHYGIDTAVMSEIEAAWEAGRPQDVHVKPVEGAHDPALDAASPEVAQAHATNAKEVPHHFLDLDKASPEDVARLEKIRSIIVQYFFLDPAHVSLRDAAIVRWAVSIVANRAAQLSATAVATVLIQTGRAKLGGGVTPPEEHVIVGVDGR